MRRPEGAIADCYEARDYARAMRMVMGLADQANQYIAEQAPWTLAKSGTDPAQVQAICSQGLNLFRCLVIYLQPVLPELAADVEAFLRTEPALWSAAEKPLLNHRINTYKPLIRRLETADLEKILGDSRADLEEKAVADTSAEKEINIDDFKRLELRIARIVKAEPVEGADKLLRLQLDLGGSERTVFAGIRAAYDAQSLQGRLTVVVANLKPRKMRFGISEGMVLAAGPGGEDIFLLAPDTGATPGMRVS